MEYGKLVDMKKGWNTLNLDGSLDNPNPVSGSMENPEMIQEVIVSGTFFVKVTFDVLKKIGLYIIKKVLCNSLTLN